LPPGPTAKAGSSRRRRFVEQHGEHVYELEAVEPDRLQQMLRNVIEGLIDMSLFNAEVEREQQDAAVLEGVRRRLRKMLGEVQLGEN
jgi:hypothetical protein